MNVTIIDPLQGDFPEVIEEYLQHGNMKCIAFNRRGTLLAAGCSDGSCVIWDFETRGVAKELRDKDCIAPITSVCWSKYGHHLLASATDRSLTLWAVKSGDKLSRVTLQQTTLLVRLHPGSCTPSTCLACPLSSAPILVDLNTSSSTVLPVSVSDGGIGALSHPRNKFADGSPPYTPTAATFNKHGDLIYVGNSKGEILIVDYKTICVRAMIPISGGSIVRNVVFSRNGQYLLTNSNDRIIRIYENLLTQRNAAGALEEISGSFDSFQGMTEKLKAVGSKCLILQREFQDAVTKIQWKAPCFSGDGEWLVGASATKGEHKIYIWDRSGYLAKILEGPKEALIDLAWHPVRPLVVSVSIAGLAYIWAKDYTENWSAFAPDFKELEENEEYVEREDEFDLVPETDKVRERKVDENEEVDIVTLEKDSPFSDSDASLEELCFLTAVPSPDITEQQEKYVGSSTKVDESIHSGSPVSVDAEQNGRAVIPPALSPTEVGVNSAAEESLGTNSNNSSKRRRKPSAKGLELQADQCRKPLKKGKSSSQSLKPKNKKNDQNTNGSVLEDDVTYDCL